MSSNLLKEYSIRWDILDPDDKSVLNEYPDIKYLLIQSLPICISDAQVMHIDDLLFNLINDGSVVNTKLIEFLPMCKECGNPDSPVLIDPDSKRAYCEICGRLDYTTEELYLYDKRGPDDA